MDLLLVIDLKEMKDSQTELTHVLESSVEVTEVLIKVSVHIEGETVRHKQREKVKYT